MPEIHKDCQSVFIILVGWLKRQECRCIENFMLLPPG